MTHRRSSSDYRSKVEQMVRAAEELTDRDQVVALEAAVAVADTHQDVSLGYDVRFRLLSACLSCGKGDVLIVAFAWCAALADRDPQYLTAELLWWNRWAVAFLPAFPDVSQAQIEEALATMGRRYVAAGRSLRAVHAAAWKTYYDMGDLPSAGAAYRNVNRCPPDPEFSSREHEDIFRLEWLEARRQYRLLVPTVDRLLTHGSPDWFQDVARTLQLVALVHLGELEQAKKIHLEVFHVCISDPANLIEVSRHLTFLAVTQNFVRGFRLVERTVLHADCGDARDQVEYYPAVALLFRCAAQAGIGRRRLRLASGCPGYHAGPVYEIESLQRAFEAAAGAIATRLDTRNGNSYYRRRQERTWALARKARPLPLKPPSSD